MKCPHCNEEISLPYTAKRNMEIYHNTVLTITVCCGKLVNAYPINNYGAFKYSGDKKEDDWGRKSK
jgi:hypothetical protein